MSHAKISQDLWERIYLTNNCITTYSSGRDQINGLAYCTCVMIQWKAFIGFYSQFIPNNNFGKQSEIEIFILRNCLVFVCYIQCLCDEDESVNTTSMISIEEWSPDQVSTWMKHIGFPQYAQSFVGEVIHFHRTYKVTHHKDVQIKLR